LDGGAVAGLQESGVTVAWYKGVMRGHSMTAAWNSSTFTAAGTTPEKIIAFRPSANAQQRVEDLIAEEKEDHLSPDEKSELDYFFQLEHIFWIAKGRAQQILTCAP